MKLSMTVSIQLFYVVELDVLGLEMPLINYKIYLQN
jgi:hypothetical protein